MIVCADDYGLAEDIDEAILELSGAGRLSAVSCMVLLERCNQELLAMLLGSQPAVDIGLHFCLTDEHLPLSRPETLPTWGGAVPAFGALFRRSLARALRPSDIQVHLAAQYELFVAKCARTPDFIDGHLHAHQLPGVREALVDFVLKLPPASRPYIRNTQLPLNQLRQRRLPWLKAGLIGVFGARMAELLRASGLRTNNGFAGIYDFRQWPKYAGYFARFADCLPDPNGILVVHPGTREEWRRQEFETLRRFPFPPGSPGRYRRSAVSSE